MFLWRWAVWLCSSAVPCESCRGLGSLYDEHFICDVCFNTGFVIPTQDAAVA